MKGTLKPASKDPLAAAIRAGIGASPNEVVEITTPEFDRPPEWGRPGIPPTTPAQWKALRSMNEAALREMDLRPWCSRQESVEEWGRYGVLFLFPAEWYDHIPEGFPITDIAGTDETFRRGVTDDDRRVGYLPFGVFCQ